VNCLPVIEMEMRSVCRKPWTFRLRLLFFLAGALACLIVLVLPRISTVTKGRTMLVLLSYLGLAYCLALGGFLTADCVSSEKRGGTLGLLLLTPLSGMDIVLGKLVCHGLQVFYGVCAVVPVFFFPLLIGGVAVAEVSRIILALTGALVFAPAVGLLVSALGTESRKTMLSTFTTVGTIATVPMLYLVVQTTAVRLSTKGPAEISPVFTVLAGFDSQYRAPGGPGQFWGSVAIVSALSATFIIGAGIFVGRAFHNEENSRILVSSSEVARRRCAISDVTNPYYRIGRAGQARSEC